MPRYPALVAFVILLALSACQPYLSTADQVDIRRVNHALDRFQRLDSYTTTLEGHIEQDMRITFAGRTETMTSDIRVSGTGRSARVADGNFDIDMQMNMALDIRESGDRIQGDVDFEMVMVDDNIYMRMTGEGGLIDAGLIDGALGEWVFLDLNQLAAAFPSEMTEIIDSFAYEAVTEYPITANTVRSVSRPSPITSDGVRLRGYRFELDMMAVLDEMGLDDMNRMIAEAFMFDDIGGFDDMMTMLNFERIIRDMYEDTTVTITAWLDEDDTLRRLDTDITMRYDINMMGVRMRMTQSSRETATYSALDEPVSIVAPF